MNLTMATRVPLVFVSTVAMFVLFALAIKYARQGGIDWERALLFGGAGVVFFGCVISRIYWGLEFHLEAQGSGHEWLQGYAATITAISHLAMMTGSLMVFWHSGRLALGRKWPMAVGGLLALSFGAGMLIYQSTAG